MRRLTLKSSHWKTAHEKVDQPTFGEVVQVLGEFANSGYLERHDPVGGERANRFTPTAQPGADEIDIGSDPSAPRDGPGREPLEVYYTAIVRVAGPNSLLDTVKRGGKTPLPAPDELEAAEATVGPPE